MKSSNVPQIHVLSNNDKISTYLSNFTCGNSNLDMLIRKDFHLTSSKSLAFVDENTDVMVAYASISCSGVISKEYVEDYDCGFIIEKDDDGEIISPRDERFSVTPAAEIKYFAVADNYHHRRLSNDKGDVTLSKSIFKLCIGLINGIIGKYIGAKYIILYAVPQAEHFYRMCGFDRFEAGMLRDESKSISDCIPMYTHATVLPEYDQLVSIVES